MKSRAQRSKPRLHLSRRGKLVIYALFGATWLSGCVWLVLHYFFVRHGEFGDAPHPLESWTLALHGACALAVLWLGGWLWTVHVRPWWSGRARRASGVVLVTLGAALIVSGYLLYYASDETLRRWTGALHWSTGLAFAVPLLVHALRSERYRGPSS